MTTPGIHPYTGRIVEQILGNRRERKTLYVRYDLRG